MDTATKTLAGQRLIVTGAGSGMGEAGARLFSEQGAAVVVVDRDGPSVERLAHRIESAGGRVLPVVADVGDPAAAASMVRRGADWLGGVDGLWCHAGINGPRGMTQLDLAAVDRTISVNLTAAIVICAEVLPLMRAAGGGSIVLTSSTAGLVASIQSPVYSATKSALVGLARSLALEGAPHRIRVNAVCPGPVDSPLLRDLRRSGPDGAATVDSLLQSIPLGRLAEPIEVANAVLWLLGQGSSFVTGIALPVDGGLTAR